MSELAIRLRGAVKRYGPITAVDGLDLDVPVGTCVGLLRPERRGQVDHDAAPDRAGDRGRGGAGGARLPASRRVEAGPRAARRRPAARQPRRDADRRAEPARLLAPLPDPARRAEGGDRALARAREARRPARLSRRQALGRDAAAAPDRARPRPPAAPRPPRRADRRPRPAGAAGAVGAHRRAAERGDDDPHVDALHRGGAAARRHRPDHVPRQGGRRRAAGRAGGGARGAAGDRGLRCPGAPRRGRVRGQRSRAEDAPDRDEHLDPRRQRHERQPRSRASAGPRTWRTCSSC